jgi:hypothetical protein
MRRKLMSNRVLALSAAAVVAVSLASFMNAARATPVADGLAIGNAAASGVESVRWGWGGFGWGLGAGLLGGAIIGGAIAAPYYYGYGPYYAPGYYYGPPGPYYPAPGYAAAPGYPAVPAGGGSAYCARKYKSYDPATGTFLGKDGARHPCP